MTTPSTSPLTFRPTEWREQLPATLSHKEVADVTVDHEDRVVLYARYEHAVYVYEPDGAYVRSWGQGTFGRAHGITFGPDRSLYCADDRHHAVRKYSLDGELLLTLGTPEHPSDSGYDGNDLDTVRCGAGPFNRCTKVAIGPTGDIYVSDGYGNARVHRFSARGELIRSWGEPGIGPGEFNLPHGVNVAKDGRVLVCDRENDRIQFFSPDGEYLDQWTDVCRPCSVSLDAAGNAYVAELGAKAGGKSYVHGMRAVDVPPRVSVFDPTGKLVARFGERGAEPGNFIGPHGIAVDSRGNVFVAEVCWTLAGQFGHVPPDCHQIQKFSPATTSDP
jgi:sugar lactone lactonase YvrE